MFVFVDVIGNGRDVAAECGKGTPSFSLSFLFLFHACHSSHNPPTNKFRLNCPSQAAALPSPSASCDNTLTLRVIAMLARGVLCRLAADVPKTSTHDLPQLSNLLYRALSARNGGSLLSPCAISRAYKLSIAEYRRLYTTRADATKPTATMRKAVKTASKKAAPKRKTATKSKPKKKAKAKPKKKPKRAKELTPEQKEKQTIKELKAKALQEPPHPNLSSYMVFTAEEMKSRKGQPVDLSGAVFKNLGEKWKNLSLVEKERYNHLTNERNAARKAEYEAWVRSYTPEQIRLANLARTRLRSKLKGIIKGYPIYTRKIEDSRQIKKPAPAYAIFLAERYQSGDLKSMAASQTGRLIKQEWEALSGSEKKKYQDEYAANRETYLEEYQRQYGHTPGKTA
ncbi:hypothetical protein CC78DRAFT_577666 [Lojkania enalia]|uniref:HMG box domain-containing protein n=1 Tax=Lojkania enalia TaxID=147567 RepID=A0A9P4KFC1_9PLEO|nr:hypothetical protein CC78DRAFT_577666 [Didymosphaeria enalia]